MIRFILICLLFLSSCSKGAKFIFDGENKKVEKEISYILYDVGAKKIVTEHNADLFITPASVFKIFTAYAALELFPYYHRFKTKVFYQGEITQGVLYGDLIIRGEGDPSLDYHDLQNIARKIKAKGIKKITGHLIYQNNYFLTASDINYSQPDKAIYNQGISSLSLRNNYVRVHRENKYKYNLVPDVDYIKLYKSKKYLEPKYLGNKSWKMRYIRNKMRIPIKDTSFYTISLIKELMELNGIKGGIIKEQDKVNGRLISLFEYKGDRLEDIIRYNLRYSHNLSSEILLLHIAKHLDCRAYSLKQGARCLKNWYSRRFPHLNWQNLEWENASGLSSKTKITANHLLEVLKKFSKKTYGYNHSSSFLAVSGMEGTLTKKYLDVPMQIWAKTGNMHYVSGMSGFLFSGNKEYLFVIIANNKKKRLGIDKIQTARPGSRKLRKLIGEANVWRKQAQMEQEQFLKILLTEE
jgi:D-alanyl-D-alanine carboxypeptidase/D-alanyl-D-alanine-endopeptidase (penicillin-binding protein 4)